MEHRTVQHHVIDQTREGQRLDNFMVWVFKNVPKSHVYKMIRKGEVRVNKKRASPDYKLKINDSVRIPPIRHHAVPMASRPIDKKAYDTLSASILYEDDHMMIINKPSGIPVHGGTRQNFGLIEMLKCGETTKPYLELVHRLDKDTSGCLIVAKKRPFLRECHQLFRNGLIKKRYLALVKGHWDRSITEIQLPLKKVHRALGGHKVYVDDEGKHASSVVKIEQAFSHATLISVGIDTGRTHQIRVHTSTLGCPVAGDDKYGDGDFNEWMRGFGLTRMFLHAESIDFTLPSSNKRVQVMAKLNHDLAEVLKAMGNHSRRSRTIHDLEL